MVFKIPETTDDDEENEYSEDVHRDAFSDRDDFISYLDDHYNTLSSRDLHIISAVTSRSEGRVQNMFSRKGWTKVDTLDKIKKFQNEESNTGIYLHIDDEKGLITIFTDDSKTTHVDNVILEDIDSFSEVNKLFISPWKIKELCKSFTSSHDNAYINEFVAKRNENSRQSVERGETNIERTINYYGDDAMERMEDFADDYGVLPTTSQLKIPTKITLRIDANGVLKIIQGDVSDALNLVDDVVEETLAVKETYQDAKTRSVELLDGEHQVTQSSPATLIPSKEFDTGDFDALIDELPEYNFAPVDPFIKRDGLPYLHTTVYDESQGIFFQIRADQTGIRLFPKKGSRDLSTFYGVFELVHKVIDGDAKPKTPEESDIE